MWPPSSRTTGFSILFDQRRHERVSGPGAHLERRVREDVSSDVIHEDTLGIVRTSGKEVVQDLMNDDPRDAVHDAPTGCAPALNRLHPKRRPDVQNALQFGVEGDDQRFRFLGKVCPRRISIRPQCIPGASAGWRAATDARVHATRRMGESARLLAGRAVVHGPGCTIGEGREGRVWAADFLLDDRRGGSLSGLEDSSRLVGAPSWREKNVERSFFS